MTNIQIALFVDVIIVSICVFLTLRHGRLAHSHPAAIYLFYHLYTVTLRLLSVSLGSPTLFSTWIGNYSPITYDEIVRAAATYDLALMVMTVAWIKASIDYSRKTIKPIQVDDKNRSALILLALKAACVKAAINRRGKTGDIPQLSENSQSTLSLRHIWRVVAVALPIGLVGIATLSRFPGTESGAVYLDVWRSSSWIIITQEWAGIAILALIYWYGFRLWLVAPLLSYILIQSLQGSGRFRVIIPIILLCQIYLDRKQLRWPPTSMILLLLTLVLMFYPLKTIGQLTQKGAGPAQILNSSTSIINSALTGKHDDQKFLDMYACGLTLIDQSGRFYYGRTYLTLLTLPIPRQWWPDKPGLGDYIYKFATPMRPMGDAGMCVTYLGEAYANFGYFGFLFIPYLLAYWLARAYFHAYRSKYLSVTRFGYLLIACNLIQVYRDGISSILVFTSVNMMPLMAIVLLHYFLPIKRVKNVPRLRYAGYRHS